MQHKERQQEILSILKNRGGRVSVKHLSSLLYASESSVRRDLNALAQQGLVKHVYGGAQLLDESSSSFPIGDDKPRNVAAKRIIATKAASLISDGSIIFLDQSSTALYLAEALVTRKALTVVTNNTQILLLLSKSNTVNVISVGGELGRENRFCLLGVDACRMFESICANTLFFSTHSISRDGIISDCDRNEILVREAMMQNAKQIVYLCDATKFGTQSAYRQCTLSDVDVLVSDESPEGRIDLDKFNIQVL